MTVGLIEHYTSNDVARRVKRQFGDESSVQVTDEDIVDWINQAQTEIAMKNHLLQFKLSLGLTLNINSYQIPDNYLEIHDVLYDDSKMKDLSLQEFDTYIRGNKDAQGNPCVYYIFNNVINFWPNVSTVPSALTIYYTRRPYPITELSDQALELPDKYFNRIVEFCMQQAYELDEDYSASQLKAGQFEANVNNMIEQESWTTRDYYPTITVLPEDL